MQILLLFLLVLAASQSLDVTPEYLQSVPFRKAVNSFTPDFYKQIIQSEKGNFLLSPFSAEAALAFVQSGCKNETGQEIRQVLHLPDDSPQTESSVKALLPLLKSDSYTLHTINKLYIKEGYIVTESFKNVATEVYGAQSENIDFTKAEAAPTINKWVEAQTENKIQNLVSAEALDNQTRTILVNALYFKGDWLVFFPPMRTSKADFHGAKGVVQVDTMSLNDEYFNYFECPHLDAKLLELPFKGGGASMTIVLPNTLDGITALENKTDAAFMPHNFTRVMVNVALPKFKFETKLDLKTVLENLGVWKVFDGNEADLSGIAGKKGDLILSKVVQKTFIEVGEMGVEAAAATYIPVIVNSMGPTDVPKEFKADHPFIFYVKVEGVILFAGRVLSP